jgi:hypothetical protein
MTFALRGILTILVFGLGAGLFMRSLYSRHDDLVLEPRSVEVALNPRQFEVITVHLQLTNHGRQRAIVKNVDTSCACTSLVTRGGQGLVEPLELSRGMSIPWQVDVSTLGQLGPQEYQVRFEVAIGNTQIRQLTSTIKMNVLPAIKIDPPEIDFSQVEAGTIHSAQIGVFDSYPGDGLQLKDIAVSDPNRIHVIMLPEGEATAATLTSPSMQSENDLKFRLRYKVTVQYRTPDVAADPIVHDRLTLIPVKQQHPRISVPIKCRMTPPEYRVSPQMLWIGPESLGRTIQRTVRCKLRTRGGPPLCVLQQPSFVKVDAVEVEPDVKDFHVTLDLPKTLDDEMMDNEIVMGVQDDRTLAFTIPIKVVATK